MTTQDHSQCTPQIQSNYEIMDKPLWRPFWDHFGDSSFLLMVTYFDLLRTYFDTRLSMSSFAPSNTEEGPKAPRRARRALQSSVGARKMGAYRPDLLVFHQARSENLIFKILT